MSRLESLKAQQDWTDLLASAGWRRLAATLAEQIEALRAQLETLDPADPRLLRAQGAIQAYRLALEEPEKRARET